MKLPLKRSKSTEFYLRARQVIYIVNRVLTLAPDLTLKLTLNIKLTLNLPLTLDLTQALNSVLKYQKFGNLVGWFCLTSSKFFGCI